MIIENTANYAKTHRTMMVSPRKRPRVSIVAGLRVATVAVSQLFFPIHPNKMISPELSSLTASSTMRRFGLQDDAFNVWIDLGLMRVTYDFFGLRIAVEMSSGPGWGGAPLGSAMMFRVVVVGERVL
jgi:hypothetical protein